MGGRWSRRCKERDTKSPRADQKFALGFANPSLSRRLNAVEKCHKKVELLSDSISDFALNTAAWLLRPVLTSTNLLPGSRPLPFPVTTRRPHWRTHSKTTDFQPAPLQRNAFTANAKSSVWFGRLRSQKAVMQGSSFRWPFVIIFERHPHGIRGIMAASPRVICVSSHALTQSS